MPPALWEHLSNDPLNFLSDWTAVHNVKFIDTWVREVDVEEPYWPVESLERNLLGKLSEQKLWGISSRLTNSDLKNLLNGRMGKEAMQEIYFRS